ncbi:MAG: OmpP1/FadL family transporter [Aestuariivirga sp.]
MKKQILAISAAVAALVAVSGSAFAAGFSIREQSAEGLGSSFAGIAAGSHGLSSMYWNPATISQHNEQGYISESNISLILPYSEAKDGVGPPGADPDSGNIGVLALVPASYSVYGLTDDITLGLAINAPLGLATKTDVWAGSPHGSSSEVFTLNVNPNVAYKIGDMLTVAVGVQGEYIAVDLESETPGGAQFFGGEADDIAFGFTAGLLFEPMDGTEIGVGFRSSISHKLKGDGFLTLVGFDDDISAKLKTPEVVTLGIKQEITDEFRLMAGVEWANWSRFKALDIIRDDTGGILASTPQDWDDSWFFSIGGEYDWTDELTVRAGFAYEDSGVPDSTRTPRVPDNDRYWVSVGASYKLNNWLTAHVAYSHIFVEDGSVNLPAGGLPPLSANFDQHIDIVSASATIDW